MCERVAYVVVANILVGIVAVAVALRGRTPGGFRRRLISLPWVAASIVLGTAMYLGQGAPSRDPIVVVNAYAQVLVVSIAEVMVCWVLIGNLLLDAARGPRWLRTFAAIIGAAVLFGIYHFAHSPPFNTPRMVGVLTAVGLLTGAFFFVSRDAYATILFHNFLGVFGVLLALAAADRLRSFERLQAPVIALAAVAMVTLIAADRFLLGAEPRS
jgi:hypothetical protein